MLHLKVLPHHSDLPEVSHLTRKCVICQEDKADKLHNVATENMGAQLKAIGQQTNNELLKVRLSNVVGSSDLLTAVAEDMKYHLLCLSHAKRDIEKANRLPKQQIHFSRLVSDLEILDMVETEISDPTDSSALNMNNIEQTISWFARNQWVRLTQQSTIQTILKATDSGQHP